MTHIPAHASKESAESVTYSGVEQRKVLRVVGEGKATSFGLPLHFILLPTIRRTHIGRRRRRRQAEGGGRTKLNKHSLFLYKNIPYRQIQSGGVCYALPPCPRHFQCHPSGTQQWCTNGTSKRSLPGEHIKTDLRWPYSSNKHLSLLTRFPPRTQTPKTNFPPQGNYRLV